MDGGAPTIGRPSEKALAVAARVNRDRLWERHLRMARHGARADGGVNRQALSPEDISARAELLSWAEAAGLTPAVDPMANLFLRRAGLLGDTAPVLSGSHMDSQPMGGRFDGIYGVLAALEVLEAMGEAGVETRHPVEAVAWTNEEGSRFAPGAMGSMAFAGKADAAGFAEVTDAKGTRLADALAATLAATPTVTRRPLGGPVHAYVEAHIEQGPVLERDGLVVGAVSGIQGASWVDVTVEGSACHAGTTPMRDRRDALQGAVRAIAALNALMDDPEDVVRFTVGRLTVTPNSPNTVPERACFSVDLRHPEAETLRRLRAAIPDLVANAAAPCPTSLISTMDNPPCRFPDAVVGRVEGAAAALGLACRRLPSGAFHDAVFLADQAPTGMIFVPCRDGLSHHPSESATPEHLHAGAQVLAACLVDLADVDLTDAGRTG